jgi:hypothetical protein
MCVRKENGMTKMHLLSGVAITAVLAIAAQVSAGPVLPTSRDGPLLPTQAAASKGEQLPGEGDQLPGDGPMLPTSRDGPMLPAPNGLPLPYDQEIQYSEIRAPSKPVDPNTRGLMAEPLNGSIKIQNRGTVNISLTLVDKDKVCGSPNPVVIKTSVSPKVPVNLEMCGVSYQLKNNAKEYIRMHDGKEVKEFAVVSESVYEVYWTGERWGFRDVTEQRLHE